MADIVVTAALVGLIDPIKAMTWTGIAAETLTKGQVVYLTTSGTFGVADANGSGTVQARGIALNAAGAGQAVTVLIEGALYGYTLADQAYSAPLYLSNTAGALADAAGATTVPCGIVAGLTDKDKTKVFYAQFRWGADWA
jgi:hypothetical protein